VTDRTEIKWIDELKQGTAAVLFNADGTMEIAMPKDGDGGGLVRVGSPTFWAAIVATFMSEGCEDLKDQVIARFDADYKKKGGRVHMIQSAEEGEAN